MLEKCVRINDEISKLIMSSDLYCLYLSWRWHHSSWGCGRGTPSLLSPRRGLWNRRVQLRTDPAEKGIHPTLEFYCFCIYTGCLFVQADETSILDYMYSRTLIIQMGPIACERSAGWCNVELMSIYSVIDYFFDVRCKWHYTTNDVVVGPQSSTTPSSGSNPHN